MRKLLFILMLFCLSSSYGQRLKYKDLFPMIWESQEETALMLLKEYLAQEPEHPNANFLLAGIYASRYLSADILTENEKALANAREVQLRIVKVRLLVNEKEIRKNNFYYLNENGFPMDWAEIDSTLSTTYNSAVKFQEEAPPVYENFTKSVAFYDQTIKAYAEICSKYNSLDNLLMLYNRDLQEKLISLRQTYDSTLHYYNAYKTLIADYPIGYNQELKIRPIERFRLQGLVARVDFLKPEINIWNYGKWANEIRDMVATDISDIRFQLSNNDLEIDRNFRSDIPAGQEYESKVDKSLVYNLEKLDFQSLPVSLLNFKDYLTALKYDESNIRYYDTASMEASSKYIFYSELINQARTIDTLLQQVKTRNTAVKRAKHEEFINERYGGVRGLQQFVGLQETQLQENFEKYVLGLRNVIVDNNLGTEETNQNKYLSYKRQKYPVWVTGMPAEIKAGNYYTTHKRDNPDGSSYLAGVYQQSGEQNMKSFVFKIKGGNIQWTRDFEIPLDSSIVKSDNILGSIELTKEGVLVVVNTSHDSFEGSLNTLFYISEAGDETFSIALEEVTETPESIKYFEDQNRFLVVFSGESATRIIAFNGVGDQLWNTTVNYTGEFIDLTGVGDGYLLTANYTQYTDRSGKQSSLAEGETSLLALRLNNRGELISDRAIDTGTGFYITHVVKASDSNINLLGYIGNLENRPKGLKYDRNLVHIILDSYNNVVASSLE